MKVLSRIILVLLSVLECALGSSAQDPLPQYVYDQFANPNVRVIRMPQGTYVLKKNLPVLARSNVKVNFGGGCRLLIDPATWPGDLYPLRIASVPRKDIFGMSKDKKGKRMVSHLSGQIKPDTTQLTMLERTNLQSGETVLIWAGVDKFDPVEPFAYIPATVKSVNMETGVITFTEPLNVEIPNYGSKQGLEAVTASALRWKALPWGMWPDNANFSKGFGADHGMERFKGGMVSNVVIDGNPTFDIAPVKTAAQIPNGAWVVSTTAINGFTINGLTVNNPLGVALHHWRSFGVRANDVLVTGQGKSKTWNKYTQEAGVVALWGGDDQIFNRVTVNGKDIGVISTEVRPSRVAVKNLRYQCEFTKARDYHNPAQILGFHSLRDTPKVEDAFLDVTWTGGSKPAYQTYSSILFRGKLEFAGPSLQCSFDWGGNRKHELDGVLVIGGVEYGPQKTKTETVTIPYVAPPASFRLPMNQGLFLKGRFRVKSKGDLNWVNDNMKARYPNFASGEWIPFGGDGNWYGIEAGDKALAAYRNASFFFWFDKTTRKTGSTVEFNYTYLPKKKS